MIAGIGIDLVSLKRMGSVHERYGERLERRILTGAERDWLPAAGPARQRRLALAFAAKEALGKALGCGLREPATFQTIEIVRDGAGAPSYRLAPGLRELLAARKGGRCHLALTDDGGMAAAVAVVEQA